MPIKTNEEEQKKEGSVEENRINLVHNYIKAQSHPTKLKLNSHLKKKSSLKF